MMFQYAFCRAYAEKHGLQLQTQPWVGDHIFQLEPIPWTFDLQDRNENDLKDGEANIRYRSYSQQQKCLIYSREDCRRWFKLRPEIEEPLARYFEAHPVMPIVGHLRRGDYGGYGYVLVGKESYLQHLNRIGRSFADLEFVSEENPHVVPGLSPDYAFLPDFYCMMKAKTLLRANSCMSWWAGTLGNGEIHSPRIDGLVGGIECDTVLFERGNHCRFADFPFTTDLWLTET